MSIYVYINAQMFLLQYDHIYMCARTCVRVCVGVCVYVYVYKIRTYTYIK